MSIEYGGTRAGKKTLAVSGLSATVQASERFVILGPSGCGKSTLLRAIGGFIPLAAGSITIDTIPVRRPSKDHIMVFQESNQLLPWRTVAGNVEFALERCLPHLDKARRRQEVEKLLDLVHLSTQAPQYPHTLSGGQKQRCAIARSFASRPALLLMDEPFGALDAITREALQKELTNLWSELQTTIIFVTHDVAEAIRIGDRVLVMTEGPGRVQEVVTLDSDRKNARDTADYLRALLASKETR